MATNGIKHGGHLEGCTVRIRNNDPRFRKERFHGLYHDDGHMFILQCANGVVIGQKENWTVEELIERVE